MKRLRTSVAVLLAGVSGLAVNVATAETWNLEVVKQGHKAVVSPDGKWRFACAPKDGAYGIYWTKDQWCAEICRGSGKLEFPDKIQDRNGNIYGVWLGKPDSEEEETPEAVVSFSECKNVTELTIPNGIAGMSANLFGAMPKLTKLEICTPAISGEFFASAPKLKTLVLGEGAETLGADDDTVFEFFDNSLAKLEIGSTLTSISEFAIAGVVNAIACSTNNASFKVEGGVLYSADATELIKVPAGYKGAEFVVPETVKTIRPGAFWGCNGIKTVRIGAAVENIGSLFLPECSVAEIAVAEENEIFASIDGVLYTKDGSVLVAYPQARAAAEYVVAPGTETVSFGAFNSAKKLKKVVLPSSVKSIGLMGFAWCRALNSVVVLGDGQLVVGEDAFAGSAITELDFRFRTVTADALAFHDAAKLAKLTVGALAFEDYAEAIFEDSGVKDFYCWNADSVADLFAAEDASGSPLFAKSFTLHTLKDSELADKVEDKGYGKTWTVAVKKDLDSEKILEFPASFPALTLNANGGTVTPKTLRIKWGEAGTLVADVKEELPVPVRKNCEFEKWEVRAEDFEDTVEAAYLVNPVKPVLYAKWDIPELTVIADDAEAGKCKTTGSGSYPAGTRVTLKAVPAKGFVFLGWYENDEPVTNGFLNATRVYVVGEDKEQAVVAKFATAEADAESLVLTFDEAYETDAEGSIEIETADTVESLTPVKVAVKGLPAGIKFDAKTGVISGKCAKPGKYNVTVYATNTSVKKAKTAEFVLAVANITSDVIAMDDSYALNSGAFADDDTAFNDAMKALVDDGWTLSLSGLPAGMRFDKKTGSVVGTAAKPGEYTVYVTATKKGQEKEVATTTFEVVFPKLEVVAKLFYDGDPTDEASFIDADATVGTVKGAGEYLAGKKVTLSAAAKKGYVFAGWWYDSADPVVQTPDCRTASVTYVTGDEDATVYALFVRAADDTAISFLVGGGEVAEDGSTEIQCADFDVGGGLIECPVAVNSWSLPKLAVSGLPAGLKFDAKTSTIVGIGAKPGVYTVTLKAVNASVKKVVSATFKLRVANIKSDHYGDAINYDDPYVLNQGVAVFVEHEIAAGETVIVSGLPAGLKWDAKKGVMSGIPTKPGEYTATIVTKRGPATFTDTVTISVQPMPAVAAGTYKGFIGYADADPAIFADLDYRGTVEVTVAATGKIAAKVVCAKGTYSFSAYSWDGMAEDGAYIVAMKNLLGAELALRLVPGEATCLEDGVCGISGVFKCKANEPELAVLADRNSLAVKGEWSFEEAKAIVEAGKNKKWEFDMIAGAEGGWVSAKPADAMRPQLTVKTDANGVLTLKGKIGGFAVSAKSDVINPDFSLVVTDPSTRQKKTLNVRFSEVDGAVFAIAELVDWAAPVKEEEPAEEESAEGETV